MSISHVKNAEIEENNSAVDRLVAFTAADMADVNALILSRADSHVDMVPELARYLIEAGGKRLRPMLTVASAYACGTANGHQIKYAAAIEFMHNATLLHDDVVDESDMRRGKPAARIVWGNQASVLVGDFLLGQAFMMMVEAGSLPALDVLSRAAAIIAEGEVLQLSKAGNSQTSEADYMQIVGAKTAKLFESACEVGAMAGQANDAQRTAMSLYGFELGLAFQLVDDVLDYGGDAEDLGKNVGDDLREGKMTLPVIIALSNASDAERSLILAALGHADAQTADVEAVTAIMKKYEALTETVARAKNHVRTAQKSIANLPNLRVRQLLHDIADFCVERVY